MKPTSFQRRLSCMALLAGIFAAASASAIPQVATPNFSPAAGAYASAQSVTITSATPGASIAYTTDSSIPAESGGVVTHGTLYSGAISIGSSTTLSAIAFESGQADSALAVAGYTVETALTLNVLYNFSASSNGGLNPAAGLVQGSDGNFYGTTNYGGSSNDGTVFKLSSTGGVWSVTTLHSFTGPDGANPQGALVQGPNGDFYGTTYDGAAGVYGTIFEITPTGAFTTLVSLNGTNNAFPMAGLMLGNDGNFYGTTSGGNTPTNYGTLFRMTPAGALTTMINFNGDGGANPASGLVQSSDGNFYGTTFTDSTGGYGTAFRMTPGGFLTTLLAFDGTDNGDGFDATPVQGSDGNFYGIIQNYSNGKNAAVTRMTPSGVLTPLAALSGGDDGNQSNAPLVLGNDGNFYGTSYSGGASNDGTLFKMTPSGVLTILVNFNGTNGADPLGGLVQGSDGNFYGTTYIGGSANHGVIFQLIIPPAAPTPASTPPLAPTPAASGGGAPSYGFLGLLAFAGILRWKLRKKQALT
jgi:uncharacterized repeat protein (TIGR03803 family)